MPAAALIFTPTCPSATPIAAAAPLIKFAIGVKMPAASLISASLAGFEPSSGSRNTIRKSYLSKVRRRSGNVCLKDVSWHNQHKRIQKQELRKH